MGAAGQRTGSLRLEGGGGEAEGEREVWKRGRRFPVGQRGWRGSRPLTQPRELRQGLERRSPPPPSCPRRETAAPPSQLRAQRPRSPRTATDTSWATARTAPVPEKDSEGR